MVVAVVFRTRFLLMTIRRLFFSRAALALALPLAVFMIVANPAAAQDSSDFFLRLNQLENQVRDLAGTVERLEFENRRLQEQLKRFQDDVEFRFQEAAGSQKSSAPSAPAKQKRSDLMPAQPASGLQMPMPASSAPSQTAMTDAEILEKISAEMHMSVGEAAPIQQTIPAN